MYWSCLAWSSTRPLLTAHRASRDADLVLLGVGHHFPRAIMLAEKWSTMSGPVVTKRA